MTHVEFANDVAHLHKHSTIEELPPATPHWEVEDLYSRAQINTFLNSNFNDFLVLVHNF